MIIGQFLQKPRGLPDALPERLCVPLALACLLRQSAYEIPQHLQCLFQLRLLVHANVPLPCPLLSPIPQIQKVNCQQCLPTDIYQRFSFPAGEERIELPCQFFSMISSSSYNNILISTTSFSMLLKYSFSTFLSLQTRIASRTVLIVSHSLTSFNEIYYTS